MRPGIVLQQGDCRSGDATRRSLTGPAVNLAQERLSTLAAWIAASSASRRTPMKGATSIGPWAVVVPADLEAPPQPAFEADALPIFVPASQAAPLNLPAIVTKAPDSQDFVANRLAHLLWLIGDGRLPPAAVVPLDDPDEALQDAIDRAGAGGLDTTVWPVLCVPVWGIVTRRLRRRF